MNRQTHGSILSANGLLSNAGAGNSKCVDFFKLTKKVNLFQINTSNETCLSKKGDCQMSKGYKRLVEFDELLF